MISLGVICLILGYWLLPLLLAAPPAIISLAVGAGWVLIVAGIVLFLLNLAGKSVGGRRFWY